MTNTVYICDESYRCKCTTGTAVSRRTAMRHRAYAESRNRSKFFPPPRSLPREEYVQNLRHLMETESSDESDSFESTSSEQSSDDRPNDESISDSSSGLSSSGTSSTCSSSNGDSGSNISCVADIDKGTFIFPTVSQDPECTKWIRASSACDDQRFKHFMENHGRLVGLSVKHCATGSFVDDLIRDATKDEPTGMKYKTFNSVRRALLRNADLETVHYPCCPEFHMLLSTGIDNVVIKCSHCKDWNGLFAQVEYIPLWNRLKARIQNPEKSKEMFEYYRKALNSSTIGDTYFDVFSGRIFEKICSLLGGRKNIQHDIFLSLSTDGVPPFKTGNYTYWPVIVTILNLPPSERYKSSNLLPVMVIPGPKSPVDLTTFLRPFIDEVQALSSDGKMVHLRNGEVRRVRVHLLLVHSDLPAMKKLAHLKGHNGLVPCRFFLIRGFFCNHSYFPPVITETKSKTAIKPKRSRNRKRRNYENVEIQLWDISNLPSRTPENIAAAYKELQDVRINGTKGELERLLVCHGLDSADPSPLLELKTLVPFASFPPDIMHLLFQNVATDMVRIWLSNDKNLSDVAHLRLDSAVFKGVDRALMSCGRGMSSATGRRQRSLKYLGDWKSHEKKVFVLSTSLVAMHECVDESALNGWNIYVQLVQRVCQWEIGQHEVEEIECLARAFYRHFIDDYYKNRSDRINMCKYVYHLLLHLGESVRNCGPMAMYSQWPTESFMGEANGMTGARNKFAESVRERLKYRAAAALYGMNNDLCIPYMDDEGEVECSSKLRGRSALDEYDGFELHHPFRQTTIADQESIFPKFRFLLMRFYKSNKDIPDEDAYRLLDDNPYIKVWGRLFHEKTLLSSPNIYRAEPSTNKTSIGKKYRAACFFSGSFRGSDPNEINVWYGKALCFVEHEVNGEAHMLVIAAWANRGLNKGEQGQVYAKGSVGSTALFSNVSIENVNCMTHPISVVEAEVPNKSGKISKRTYFIDDLREQHGMLSGEPWKKSAENILLMGLCRSSKRQRR